MDITKFLEAPEVVSQIDQLRKYWNKKKKKVSDIVDDDGNQYVDIVMEGGGVLGIALVGYTYALESVGIRFLGIGGTSAGAINALLVSAVDVPENPKSERILEELSKLEMFSFVDGDNDARDFVKAMIEGAGIFKLGWKGIQVLDNIRDDLGLNPGKEFEKWMSDILKAVGVKTLLDLQKRMNILPPGLRIRNGKKLTLKDAGSQLSLVAADITTETKAVFPEMADVYFKNPNQVNPARFVRASMSIPGCFHPYRVKNIPQGKESEKRWDKKAGYIGRIPNEVLFVDGGIMSNFPIDLFHSKGVPLAPTFGAKLGTDRNEPHKTEKPAQFIGAIFNSARHCADYDFILRNPDYKLLLATINTGEYNWLNFFMDEGPKVDLFLRGVKEAVRFLKKFDWVSYKNVREKLA